MAVNTAYPLIRRPHAWVGMDAPHCYDRRVWFEAFDKFTDAKLSNRQVGGVVLRDCPRTYFFEVSKGGSPANMLVERGHDALFSFHRNCFFVALHLLIWMGARRIHLVGCDMGVNAGTYHDDRAIGRLAVEQNVEQMRDLCRQAQQLAVLTAEQGIELVSCTEGSPLNSHMRWLPLAEAVELSARRTPLESFERCRRINARELMECEWRGRVEGDEGVLVGCDRDQEWLLEWWHGHYMRHENRPLAIIDMGMSAAVRTWADEHSDVRVIELETDPEQFRQDNLVFGVKSPSRAWFYKPAAILHSPWRRTLWIDLDVEVRGGLDEHFAMIEEGHIAGAGEYLLLRSPCVGTMINSGVLGVCRGEPLVEQWARYCFSRHAEFYGDQDVLNYVLWERSSRPVIYMPHMCRVRLEGDDEPTVCFHWTGVAGKDHIRQMIRDTEASLATA